MKREIKTTLVLDGEQKFKQELQAAAREMRVLKSETRANTLAFGDNAKSVDALTIRNQGLARQAEQQREIVAALSRAVEEAAEKYGEADRRTDDYRIRLNNARAALSRIENEIRKNNTAIKEQTDRWRQVADAAERAGRKITTVGKGMTKVGDGLTRGVTVPIVAAGTAALKASIDFETAWTGVLKTVDGTEAQLAALKQGIIDMSQEIPATTTEIAAVAEAAGQLGIETDNILAFTRTMIDLGETTNIVSSEAAKQLAQFANVTQMSQRDFDRLGSVIVDLGNNFATTEADIVNMAQRLAGAGKQIGLTNPQIMAFATTLSSVGIAAEAGGSAFSKVFSNMQLAVETGSKSLNDFAKVSGMSADQFSRAFREDASTAIAAFITGLSKMDEQGVSSIKTLDDMGITELRLRDTLLRASNAGDLVTNALTRANAAWESNSALTKEAEQRYATTASQLKMVRNEAQELLRQFGDAMIPTLKDAIGGAKDLVRGFSNLSDAERENIVKTAALVAVMGPAISMTGRLVTNVGGAVTQFSKLSSAISKAGGLGAVMAGPAGWVVAAAAVLGGLALAVGETSSGLKELTADANELESAMGDAANAVSSARDKFADTEGMIKAASDVALGYIARLEDLESAGLDTAESQREYEGILTRLKELIPELNIEIDEQTGLLIDGASALREQVSGWKELAIQQAMQEQVTELVKAHTDALVDLTKAKNELTLKEERYAEVMDRLDNELIPEIIEATGKTQEEFDDLVLSLGSTWRALDRLWVLAPELVDEWQDLQDEASDLDYGIKALNRTIANGELTIADLAKELNTTEQAVQDFMDSLDKDPVSDVTEALDGLDESIRTAGDDARAASYGAGESIGQGLVDGITSKTRAVETAAKKLAKTAERGMKRELKIASPSKVGEDIGENFGDSISRGMEKAFSSIERAAVSIATAATPPAPTSGGGGGLIVQVTNNFNLSGNPDQSTLRAVEDASARGIGQALQQRGQVASMR